jgi:hypothetical protein
LKMVLRPKHVVAVTTNEDCCVDGIITKLITFMFNAVD